jgi:hypothetical protein
VIGKKWTTEQCSVSSLESDLAAAKQSRNKDDVTQALHMIVTSKGHWDFASTDLGGVHFRPERLKDYLRRAWSGVT